MKPTDKELADKVIQAALIYRKCYRDAVQAGLSVQDTGYGENFAVKVDRVDKELIAQTPERGRK